ncbi:hypothetical protein T10_12743 [Trichinella papuae]|uniref:Uncharacterized protein n=1 Tax=Trichinella papuae TaxID=268474 RepID=A0A0V1MV32_9BILA|nr:hypothetical protein T10_12743 [Trichinella papuae]
MYWSCGQWVSWNEKLLLRLLSSEIFGSSFCAISRKQLSALKQLLHHCGREWTLHLQFLPLQMQVIEFCRETIFHPKSAEDSILRYVIFQ